MAKIITLDSDTLRDLVKASRQDFIGKSVQDDLAAVLAKVYPTVEDAVGFIVKLVSTLVTEETMRGLVDDFSTLVVDKSAQRQEWLAKAANETDFDLRQGYLKKAEGLRPTG